MSEAMMFPADDDRVASFSRSGVAMNTVSAEVDARSRKNSSTILQKLNSVGLRPVADALGVNDSTISRMKDGDIERMGMMLAVLGLKVVPQEMELMDMQQVEAMLTLTRAHINSMTSASALVLDRA